VHVLRTLLWFLDGLVVTYFLVYAGINIVLLVISALAVRRTLQESQLTPRRHRDAAASPFAPLITLVVPAYNEEVTIVESVRSLLRLRYPAYEIVIVNDGSKDRTVDVLKEAFAFVRNDVDYDPHLGTQPIRGFYRTTQELPPQVARLVLVDKENGGKADALNAGINASQGAYVATMDADSLMIERALEEAVQPLLDDPNRVIACGGQIALTNGCRVEDGKVVSVGVPKPWIARFQVVEYLRSFTQGRTALGRLNALLILSGVFALIQREALIAVGGFLTRHMRSRIGLEYCGQGAETVCEDMEVIVRLHRYVLEHKMDGRIVFLPVPTSWTEAPEVWRNLGKQRSRWYRGLLEVLWFHRKMMFRPRYGRIGLFALPYQLFFEALAPVLELLGYLVLPLSYLAGLFSARAFFAFAGMAVGFTFFLSVASLVVAVNRIRARDRRKDEALLDYRGAKNLLILALSGLLSNLGYRQYLLYWQLRGLKDFFAGRKGWDKFARKGFQLQQ
jgi:cellulose synthase/poly-beta-1,6-N-acetylglucosamine synthase-like glycosyltransferase